MRKPAVRVLLATALGLLFALLIATPGFPAGAEPDGPAAVDSGKPDDGKAAVAKGAPEGNSSARLLAVAAACLTGAAIIAMKPRIAEHRLVASLNRRGRLDTSQIASCLDDYKMDD